MGSAQNNSSPVSHFSHPQHPLEVTTAPPTENTRCCFGCNLRLTQGEAYYTCKTCLFSLHHICYNIPLITNHPSHPNHDLVLLAIPPSSSPAFTELITLNCMACRKNNITGFCYHCAECNIFFHSLCITLPLSLSITHHIHKIKLEFSPPYDFFCDLCKKPSYNNGWLYRCSMCEFDIHVACAVENIKKTKQIGEGNLSMKNVDEVELQERTPLRDKMTPLSDDHTSSTTPPPSSSCQFSDSFFSIDLTKSYSNHRNQVRREASSECMTQSVVSSNSMLAEEEPIGVVNWLKNHYSYSKTDQNNKPNHAAAFSKGGRVSDFEESNQKGVTKEPKHSLAKWSIKDQRVNKSESEERNSCSDWRKLLTCCL